MRNKMFLALLGFIFFLFLVVPTSAYAKQFYSWFERGPYYGVWANISTPAETPTAPYYTPNSMNSNGTDYTHQSHSVTTAGGDSWVQAGWIYYPYYNQPIKYYEYKQPGVPPILIETGSQSWGTSIKYEVSHDIGQTWCIWIGETQIRCVENTDPAPNTMIAQSEVHYDPNTRMQTQFTEIRLKDATGTWVLPYISSPYMHRYFPYNYTVISSSSFSTSRKTTTDRFIPLITDCDVCWGNP